MKTSKRVNGQKTSEQEICKYCGGSGHTSTTKKYVVEICRYCGGNINV